MRTLPTEMVRVLAPFAPLFSERAFRHVQVLLAGAILAPGRRTVSSALHAMGLDQHERFHRYHRVLSHAVWSSREAGRMLLELLVEAFVPQGPVVVGIDETLERRQGKKIAAKGIYRDPVRSSHGHFVKTSAPRWVCVTLLAEVPWASRVWALAFLCVAWPLPSATLPSGASGTRSSRSGRGSRSCWCAAGIRSARVVAVADGGYASLKLLDRCRRLSNPIALVTRLRLDAALYEPAPPRRPGQRWEDPASRASGWRTSPLSRKTLPSTGRRLR